MQYFAYAFILIRTVLGSYLVDMAHDLFKNFVSAYYLKNEWMEFNIGIKDTSWNCHASNCANVWHEYGS